MEQPLQNELERIEQEHAARYLLRTAGNLGNTDNTLLRAARGVSETDPEHLLRAHTNTPL